MYILVVQRFRQNLLVVVSNEKNKQKKKSSFGGSHTSKEGSDTLASSGQSCPTQKKPENGSVYPKWGRTRNIWRTLLMSSILKT